MQKIIDQIIKERLPTAQSGFQYNINSFNKDYLNYCKISEHYISCLGFIGDLIAMLLYTEAECTGWIEDIPKYEMSAGQFSNYDFFAFSFRNKVKQERQIRDFLTMVCKNWDMNIECVVEGDIMIIIVDKKSYLSSKWKMQAVMRIVRAIWYEQSFIKQDIIQFDGLFYNGYATINTERYGTELQKNALLYTMAHHKIDNELSYIQRKDPIYGSSDMTQMSQTKGILSFITEIAVYYEILKNKI